ncbi:exonuclease VIII|nr:exonuclease VIII [Candidatus Pantoea persica]
MASVMRPVTQALTSANRSWMNAIDPAVYFWRKNAPVDKAKTKALNTGAPCIACF